MIERARHGRRLRAARRSGLLSDRPPARRARRRIGPSPEWGRSPGCPPGLHKTPGHPRPFYCWWPVRCPKERAAPKDGPRIGWLSASSNQHDNQNDQQNCAKTAANVWASVIKSAATKQHEKQDQHEYYVQGTSPCEKRPHASVRQTDEKRLRITFATPHCDIGIGALSERPIARHGGALSPHRFLVTVKKPVEFLINRINAIAEIVGNPMISIFCVPHAEWEPRTFATKWRLTSTCRRHHQPPSRPSWGWGQRYGSRPWNYWSPEPRSDRSHPAHEGPSRQMNCPSAGCLARPWVNYCKSSFRWWYSAEPSRRPSGPRSMQRPTATSVIPRSYYVLPNEPPGHSERNEG